MGGDQGEKSNSEEEEAEDQSGLRRENPLGKIPLWPPLPSSFSDVRSPLPGLTLTISTTLARERGKGNYEDDIAERQPRQRPGETVISAIREEPCIESHEDLCRLYLHSQRRRGRK